MTKEESMRKYINDFLDPKPGTLPFPELFHEHQEFLKMEVTKSVGERKAQIEQLLQDLTQQAQDLNLGYD